MSGSLNGKVKVVCKGAFYLSSSLFSLNHTPTADVQYKDPKKEKLACPILTFLALLSENGAFVRLVVVKWHQNSLNSDCFCSKPDRS